MRVAGVEAVHGDLSLALYRAKQTCKQPLTLKQMSLPQTSCNPLELLLGELFLLVQGEQELLLHLQSQLELVKSSIIPSILPLSLPLLGLNLLML